MHWARPLLLLTLALPAQAQTLDLLVFPAPGIFEVSSRNEVSGPGAVMLGRLGEVSGLALRLNPVPAARALQMLIHLPGHCAAGVPRLPEHEHQLRWAGLIASGALMLYGRADETRQVGGPQDLRGATIVAQRESFPAAWLHEHGLSVHEVNDTVTGLRMLRAGRVDYWLVNDLAGQRAIQRIQRSEGPPPKPLRNFGQIDVYLACHRDLAPATAERLTAGLEQLRRNGELAAFGLR
jgi:polar amino acid transport system substrate-binding protein